MQHVYIDGGNVNTNGNANGIQTISGSVIVSNTVTISGSVYIPGIVSVSGSVALRPYNTKGSFDQRGLAVAGSATSMILPANTSGRKGIWVGTSSTLYDLYVDAVASGAAAPTITASNYGYIVPAGTDRYLPIGQSIAVYGMNSSAAATTIAVNITEDIN